MTRKLICKSEVRDKQFYFADLCIEYLETVLHRMGVVSKGAELVSRREGENDLVVEVKVKQRYNKKRIKKILEGEFFSDKKEKLGTKGVLTVKEINYVSYNDSEPN